MMFVNGVSKYQYPQQALDKCQCSGYGTAKVTMTSCGQSGEVHVRGHPTMKFSLQPMISTNSACDVIMKKRHR